MTAVKEDGVGIGNELQKSAASAKKVAAKSHERIFVERLQHSIKGLESGYAYGTNIEEKKTKQSVAKALEKKINEQSNNKRQFYTHGKLMKADTTGDWNWVNKPPPPKASGNTRSFPLKNPLPHGTLTKDKAYFLNNSSHQQLDSETDCPKIELIFKGHSGRESPNREARKHYVPRYATETVLRSGKENKNRSLQRWMSQSQVM